MHQCGPEHIGEKFPFGDHFHVDPFGSHAHQIFDLGKHRLLYFFESLHFGHVPGLDAHHFLGITAIAIVQADIHSMRDDEEDSHLGAGDTGNVAVHAAGCAIIPGLFHREGVVLGKEFDVAVVPDKSRHPQAGAHHFQGLFQKQVRSASVDPYRQGVVGQVGVFGGFQKQVGQFVGGVGTIFFLPADGPVVPFSHAGVFRPVGLTGYPVDLHHFAPHDLQKLQHLIVSDKPSILIVFVVGVHVLVKPAGGRGGRRANHQECKPEGL